MTPLLKYHIFVAKPDNTEWLWVSHYDFNEAVGMVEFKISADLEDPSRQPAYETISVTVEDSDGKIHEVLRYGNGSPEPVVDNRPMPEFAL